MSIKFFYDIQMITYYFSNEEKFLDRFEVRWIYIYFVTEIFHDKNLSENRISLIDRSDSWKRSKLKNNEKDMTSYAYVEFRITNKYSIQI